MNEDLNKRIEELETKFRSMEQSSFLPLPIDQTLRSSGFLKETFFVAGTGEIASNGTYELTIPGSTRTSVVLVTPFWNAGAVSASMVPAIGTTNFGSSTSQFDITNPAGDTFRYTWDGTGTNPNISAATVPVGTRILVFIGGNSANSNATSRPFFSVTGSGNDYFEVSNSTPGVAENNVTIGVGGSITGGITGNYAVFAEGTATDQFQFVVFLFKNLFAQV